MNFISGSLINIWNQKYLLIFIFPFYFLYSNCSEGRWRIYFTKHQDETKKDFEELSENISKLVMVFYGSNGKSNPVSMENKVEHQAKNQITYDVKYYIDLSIFAFSLSFLMKRDNNVYTVNIADIIL